MKNKNYGWLIVIAGFLLSGVNVGINTNCNTAFLKPVCESLGLSMSSFALTASISAFISIPCLLVIPFLMERISARRLILICGAGFILFKILFGCSDNLWQFYICAAGIGIFSSGIGYLTVNSLLNGWFTEKNGLAVGIASSGAGIVGAAVLPLVTWVIETFGWRHGYYLEAVLSLIFIGIAYALIKEEMPLKKEIVAAGGEGRTSVGDIITLTLLSFGLFIVCAIGLGIQPYLMTYMQSLGYTAAFAAAVVSAILVINTFAKVISGYVFDKMKTGWTILMITAFMLSSLLLLLSLGKGEMWIYLFVAVFAFAYVNMSIPAPFLTKRLFGSKTFTKNYSIVMIVTSLGGAAGNVITSILYEGCGSYRSVWFIYIVLMVLAGLSLLLAVHGAQKRRRE